MHFSAQKRVTKSTLFLLTYRFSIVEFMDTLALFGLVQFIELRDLIKPIWFEMD